MPNDRDVAVDELLTQSVNKGVKISNEKLAMFCRGSLEENRKMLQELEAAHEADLKNYTKYPDQSEARRNMRAEYKKTLEQFHAVRNPLQGVANSWFKVATVWNGFSSSEKMNPQQAVAHALDSCELSIDKKMEILSFARENAEKVMYPNTLELSGDAKLKQEKAALEFNTRFGIQKIVKDPEDATKDKIKKDIYEGAYSDINNNLMMLFATPYQGVKDQTVISRGAAKGILAFCNQKLKDYHRMMLTGDMKKEFTDHTDPYLNGPDFRKTKKDFEVLKSIAGREQQKSLSDAKLFGRGSKQFDRMKDDYQDLRKATIAYTQNPNPANLKKLSEQSEITRKSADAYLKMKQEQIMKREIPGSVTSAPDRKSIIFKADNPNTQKRMDYANGLLGELNKLDAFIQQKQPKKTLDSPIKSASKPVGGPVM